MFLKYRLAVESDYVEINDFYNKMYHKNRSLEEFYWAFHNTPFGPALYVIALDDGKIIGTNAVIPIELKLDNEVILSGKSEDTLVHPDYRGKEVFKGMYALLFQTCRDRGIQFIWGFTNAKKPFNRMGFEIPFDAQQCIAVHAVFKSYNVFRRKHQGLLKNIKYLLFCCVSKVYLVTKMRKIKSRFKLVKNNIQIGKLQALIDQRQRQSDWFSIHENSAFVQWRIYQNPYFKVVNTFSYYSEEELVGFVSVATNTDNVSCIQQLFFSKQLTPQDQVHVLQEVMQHVFYQGTIMIKNWVFGTTLKNLEQKNNYINSGYLHLKKGQGFVWKNLDQLVLNPKNFQLSHLASLGQF